MNDNKIDKPEEEPRSRRLRTGLLVVGSALFGGIAVVLWNRRILASMQNECRNEPPKPISVDDDAIY